MKRNEKEKEKVESARDIFTEGEEMDQVIWSIMSVMWSGYAGTLVGAERWENQLTADNPAFARDSLLLTPPTTVPSKWYLFVWCSSTNTSGAGS